MIVLNDFLGDKFKYDEPSQSISFELTDNQRAAAMASNTRTRPRWFSTSWGSVVNYTLFGSATSGLSPRQTTPHMLHDATQDGKARRRSPTASTRIRGAPRHGEKRRHQHVAGSGSGLAQKLHGLRPRALQSTPSSGTYSDTVVLTISY